MFLKKEIKRKQVDSKVVCIPQFKEYEVSICECDNCGVKFESKNINQNITFKGGFNGNIFVAGEYHSRFDDYINYKISKDLCDACINEIIENLNSQLYDKISEVTNNDNVLSQIESLK